MRASRRAAIQGCNPIANEASVHRDHEEHCEGILEGATKFTTEA